MAPPWFKKTILAALPGTVLEIREKTGLAGSTIRRWARKLSEVEMHIERYIRTKGLYTPYYVAGPGKDAKEPRAMSGAEYCRRWRKKARKSGELEFVYARRHARDRANRAEKQPQSWLSALGL